MRLNVMSPRDHDTIQHYRSDIIQYLDEIIGECDWVLGSEHLDTLTHNSGKPGSFIAALLDLTNYEHEAIVVKSFEIIYRFFNATHTLFSEALRVQLLMNDESRKFAHYLDEHLPVLRRLGAGMVEESDQRSLVYLNYSSLRI